jgi:hypothetical protein
MIAATCSACLDHASLHSSSRVCTVLPQAPTCLCPSTPPPCVVTLSLVAVILGGMRVAAPRPGCFAIGSRSSILNAGREKHQHPRLRWLRRLTGRGNILLRLWHSDFLTSSNKPIIHWMPRHSHASGKLKSISSCFNGCVCCRWFIAN